MLAHLKRRALKSGLKERMTMRLCSEQSLELDEFRNSVDFALAFAVVHEVPDADSFFREISALVKPRGLLLFAEPRGHVSGEEFRKSLDTAGRNGFEIRNYPRIRGCISAVLIKNN
jgi:SAM-dependent methyltransferase